jgi:hypothetical protein
VLGRWSRGKGTLLDLEFLTDDQGRRVAGKDCELSRGCKFSWTNCLPL